MGWENFSLYNNPFGMSYFPRTFSFINPIKSFFDSTNNSDLKSKDYSYMNPFPEIKSYSLSIPYNNLFLPLQPSYRYYQPINWQLFRRINLSRSQQFSMPLFNINYNSTLNTNTYTNRRLDNNRESIEASKLKIPKIEAPKLEPKLNTSTTSFSILNSNTGLDTFERHTKGISLYQEQLIKNALSFKGKVNNKREGNKLFSRGNSQAYCADFVTYNVKKIYGNKIPSNIGCAIDPTTNERFGPSAVRGWQLWAQQNNCYIDMTDKKDKNSFLAKNIKPGDIMIEKRGGKSHTGIVTEVYTDNKGITHFKTIEGNVSNQHKVDTRDYTADSSTLSGFIKLDKYIT